MDSIISLDLAVRVSIIWLCISLLSFLLGNRFANIKKDILFITVFRFLVAWIALSVLFFKYESCVAALFLPCFEFVINFVQDDYEATLSIVKQKSCLIQLTSILKHDIAQLRQGSKMASFIDSLHFVMSQALLFSILCAWPVKLLSSRLKLFLLGVPLAFLLAGLTTPILLAGMSETTFQHFDKTYESSHPHLWLSTWAGFIENIGSWVKSLIFAILGGLILQGFWFSSASIPVSEENTLG